MTTKAQKRRRKATDAGETHFIGRVCSKHPELKGRRTIRRARCPGCAKALRQKKALWEELRPKPNLFTKSMAEIDDA